MKSSSSRDLAIRQELSTILDEYGEQEREVLLVVARRLLTGQRTIGRLDVHTDRRDWRSERSEELFDALIYTAIGEFSKSEQGPVRRNCSARTPEKRCGTCFRFDANENWCPVFQRVQHEDCRPCMHWEQNQSDPER
jgi:hypothetical protein